MDLRKDLAKTFAGYTRDPEMPLAAYALTVAVYNLLLGGTIRIALRNPGSGGVQGLEKSELKELLLLGVATHKLSRTITKDAVTAPFRAAFTRYEDSLGYGEFQETSRRSGMLGSIGDLLSCNYCADPWVALGLMFGLSKFPRPTRYVISLFTSVAVADLLHVWYEATRSRENVLTLREKVLEKKAA